MFLSFPPLKNAHHIGCQCAGSSRCAWSRWRGWTKGQDRKARTNCEYMHMPPYLTPKVFVVHTHTHTPPRGNQVPWVPQVHVDHLVLTDSRVLQEMMAQKDKQDPKDLLETRSVQITYTVDASSCVYAILCVGFRRAKRRERRQWNSWTSWTKGQLHSECRPSCAALLIYTSTHRGLRETRVPKVSLVAKEQKDKRHDNYMY